MCIYFLFLVVMEITSLNTFTDFSVVMLKGKSTRKLTGLICEAVRGQGRKQSVKDFCLRYSLKLDRRFNPMRHGGEKSAIHVAQAWCSKMQYLYDIYTSSGFVDYTFSQADKSGWEEPEYFTALAEAWKTDKNKAPAIEEIRALCPNKRF